MSKSIGRSTVAEPRRSRLQKMHDLLTSRLFGSPVGRNDSRRSGWPVAMRKLLYVLYCTVGAFFLESYCRRSKQKQARNNCGSGRSGRKGKGTTRDGGWLELDGDRAAVVLLHVGGVLLASKERDRGGSWRRSHRFGPCHRPVDPFFSGVRVVATDDDERKRCPSARVRESLREEEMIHLSKEDIPAENENEPEEKVPHDDGHDTEPIDMASLIEGLPDSVALQCLARVPLHYHPVLRRVSRAWRSALQSPDLFRTRRLAGVEEEWLYASAYEPDKVWQAYDPILDCWSTLPVLPSCIKHLANFGTASVDGKLYVVGGGSDEVYPQTGDWNETTATNEVWRFDPITGKWEQRAPMITSRSQFACCVMDERIVAAGGFTNTRKALALAEIYNPASDTWESLPDLSQVHNAACSGIVFEGKVHVVHKGTSIAQVYDAKNSRWVLADSGWSGGEMAVVNGELYVVRHGLATREEKQPPFWKLLSSWPECMRRISFGVVGLGGDLYVIGGVIPPPNISGILKLDDVDICNVGSENPNWRKGANMTLCKGTVLGCATVKL